MFSGALGLRHYWFQTHGWDLGIFDQAIYLISRGWPAESSLLGFHILGDHGALVLYPIGWISSFFPSITFLFVLQGMALASGVFPLAKMARQNFLSRRATAVSLFVFLLYPIIFNTAIFDFHPEVFAVPLLLEALVILADSHSRAPWRVLLYLLFALTCKITISLLVFGIGVWLLLQKKRLAGFLTCALGVSWFLLVGWILIPSFGGENANIVRHTAKYSLQEGTLFDFQYLQSISGKLFVQIVSPASIEYLFLLILPVIYLLMHRSRRRLLFDLLPFTPLLILNLAATMARMTTLVYQYSLLLVPFLAVSVQRTLSSGPKGIIGYPTWMHRRGLNIILVWSILTFLIFSRASFFLGPFQDRLETASDRREAISYVGNDSAVLTSDYLTPHLSRRKIVVQPNEEHLEGLDKFDNILLDTLYPGWNSSIEEQIISRLENNPDWFVKYRKGSVVLFEKSTH